MELENEDGGEDKMNGSRSTGLVIIYVFVRETVIYTVKKQNVTMILPDVLVIGEERFKFLGFQSIQMIVTESPML